MGTGEDSLDFYDSWDSDDYSYECSCEHHHDHEHNDESDGNYPTPAEIKRNWHISNGLMGVTGGLMAAVGFTEMQNEELAEAVIQNHTITAVFGIILLVLAFVCLGLACHYGNKCS